MRISPKYSLLILLGMGLVAGTISCTRPASPPHIFVFLVDTLRADHLGCYGYSRDTSPNLDVFAEDAVLFRHAYTPSPWTRPAVASLFTGAPPAIHGIRGRNGWAEPSVETWAERLEERGYYTTAHFANGNLESRYGLGQGFADYVFEKVEKRPYANSLEMEERWAEALPGPEDADKTPIFSYLHSMDPHAPFSPKRAYSRPFVQQPVPWRDWFHGDEEVGTQLRIDINRYDAEIRQSDAAFGLFLEELKQRGWYEDSWIVFVADHGEEFREHGYRGHGNGLWENLLRVPLVVRPPGGRAGAHGPQLLAAAMDEVPIHAVADMIGSCEWVDWQSLGLANAEWTGLPAETLAHWIPSPESWATPVRRGSFVIDGRAGWMVAEGQRKLIWNEFPEAGFLQLDAAMDPLEQHAKFDPDSLLLQELEAWYRATARGLEVEATQTGTIQLQPEGAFRGAHLPPGTPAGSVRQRRAEGQTTLIWDATPGARLLLDRDVDQHWMLENSEGEWVELEDTAAEAGLTVRAVGRPREADALPQPMSDELRQQLKALGYLQ